jgi:hypothetical protein
VQADAHLQADVAYCLMNRLSAADRAGRPIEPGEKPIPGSVKLNAAEPGQASEMKRLAAETVEVDVLIAKAQEHIAFAKERRAALITAAVTGQIDVRAVRKAG